MIYNKKLGGYILNETQKEIVVSALTARMIQTVKKNAHKFAKDAIDNKIKLFCPEDELTITYNMKIQIKELLELL